MYIIGNPHEERKGRPVESQTMRTADGGMKELRSCLTRDRKGGGMPCWIRSRASEVIDMDQLAAWLDAIKRPTFMDDGWQDRAVAEMCAAGVDHVFPLLCERLKAADPEARCDAITALLFLDAYGAVPPIVSMLHDPDRIVRWH